MLALVGRSSLHGYYAYLVYWTNGQKQRETFFSFMFLSVSSEFSGKVLGFTPMASLDWEGYASWATLPVQTCWC